MNRQSVPLFPTDESYQRFVENYERSERANQGIREIPSDFLPYGYDDIEVTPDLGKSMFAPAVGAVPGDPDYIQPDVMAPEDLKILAETKIPVDDQEYIKPDVETEAYPYDDGNPSIYDSPYTAGDSQGPVIEIDAPTSIPKVPLTAQAPAGPDLASMRKAYYDASKRATQEALVAQRRRQNIHQPMPSFQQSINNLGKL